MKNIYVNVKNNEEKIIPYIWINEEEREVSLHVNLTGDGGNATVAAIFIGSGNKSITFNTNVLHKGKKTKSLTTIRGVFFDRSSFSNDGMVRIAKGAKGSDGYFASKILLFDDAKGRSVPSLEIDENDLKAGHASTVGRPDENQMFYLRSRGLSEEEAEKLLVSGFFEPILSYFPKSEQKNLRKQIEEAS